MSDSTQVVKEAFAAHLRLATQLSESHVGVIAQISNRIVDCLKAGGKVLWCGNGGSAADAQHLAAELVGRFKKERAALPAIALTVDTSILTCVGNDYGFNFVFSRQVDALMTSHDVLVAISTSGNSQNVIEAVKSARKKGGFVVGFLGNEGGKLKSECDLNFTVPSNDTARIQEMHIFAGHTICSLVDLHFS
jgi:D-sedoheptulose 7-phosphate isomerase